MESPINLFILLFLVAMSTAIIAYIAIYNRKKQQKIMSVIVEGEQEKNVEESQPTVVEEECAAVVQNLHPTVSDEEQRQLAEAERRHLEEESLIVEDEIDWTEEECKRLEEEENWEVEQATQKAKEEGHRKLEELQVAEEGLPKVEKERMSHEEEVRNKGDEGEEKLTEKILRRIPIDRRPPRRPVERSEKKELKEVKYRSMKPEIVCRKSVLQWILAVEVPEEILSKPKLAVRQNGLLLTPEESNEGCWYLKQAIGSVMVQWHENELAREIKITLGEEDYLIFKLSGLNQNQGRRIKSTSYGSYLIVVPDNWERDEALSGPPPVVAEPVSLEGYKVHFFDLEKKSDGKISFLNTMGKSTIIESKTPQFELVGNRLNDVSRNWGPLFGDRPPKINAQEVQMWKDVGTLVVGEEGSGKGKWRREFTPVPEEKKQNLPPEISARKGGWYFLRFYNMNDDLIESLEFRFICALNKIRILQSFPLPSEDGHKPVCVEFLHEPGCVVKPADNLRSIQFKREDDKTILIIPPDPDCDHTKWLVCPEGGPQVEVTILVERIWWAVSGEQNALFEWEDQVLTLQREDFAAISKKILWFRLPRRRWVDEVLVGFEQSKARPYSIKVTQKTVCIPLRDFGDAQELQRVGITPINLWFCREGTTYTGTPCEFKAKIGCRTCDFTASKKEDMFHHVESVHMENFFRLLTYAELRARVPSLPFGIYKCYYCPIFVRSDDPLNPTSTIIKHIEYDCPNILHGMGPVKIRFEIVTDIEQVRENVISNIPLIHKCKLCDFDINEANHGDMMRHIIKTHRNRIYELR